MISQSNAIIAQRIDDSRLELSLQLGVIGRTLAEVARVKQEHILIAVHGTYRVNEGSPLYDTCLTLTGTVIDRFIVTVGIIHVKNHQFRLAAAQKRQGDKSKKYLILHLHFLSCLLLPFHQDGSQSFRLWPQSPRQKEELHQ